ncbi:hypothetical protein C2I18_22765 [Paenibacillus sp. PK3_47]|uniref:DUF2812 domain-containing protein n=1 Tax=Paenibacillus sp. PK3_47 TaxID=2072642 RepID=UPI00201D830E|nr:DUF2812 domain-containing protein [Paenibacillus sp. PK3_47]UQZ36103.1 hypothetical protein C2I18_22765 [Paenibacillus sp. PK3_47]
MKTVIKPFWSYDLPGTEAWLASMAGEGWRLDSWNTKLRRFSFRKDNSVSATYQISYDSSGNSSLASFLAAEGWTIDLQGGRWSVLRNEREPGRINAYPSRKGIIRRNRMISYFFMGTMIYLSAIAVLPLIIISLSLFRSATLQIEKSPMWWITFAAAVLGIALFILAVYSIHKIRTVNKTLLPEQQIYRDKAAVREPSGPQSVRLKLGWMYSPDKLEKWLEDKERQGWNLYKVGRWGTLFFFSKGSPRRMNYHADYQIVADEGSVELHTSAGWTKAYSSPSSLQKWTIWRRESAEGEAQTQLYSDKLHLLKHARKIALSYTLLFLPMLLLYTYNLSAFVERIVKEGFTTFGMWNTLLLFISILAFGSFTGRTWLYYRRLKKS